MGLLFDLWGFIRQDFRNMRLRARKPLSYDAVSIILTVIFFLISLVGIAMIATFGVISSPWLFFLFIPLGLIISFMGRFIKYYGDKHSVVTIFD